MKRITVTKAMLTRFDSGCINVNRTKDIPSDYYGLMGVPITFLDKWCKDQFDLLDNIRPRIGDRNCYQRLIIRKKLTNEELFALNVVYMGVQMGLVSTDFREIEMIIQGD